MHSKSNDHPTAPLLQTAQTHTSVPGAHSDQPVGISQQEIKDLIASLQPLLSLLIVCDEVFEWDGALEREKAQIGLGRIYRQWKKTNVALDPQFDSRQFRSRDD